MPGRQQIKDLGIVLKDFEGMVKQPNFLRTGRRIENFNLLPREAWGNWLLCAVLCEFFGRDITFAEDEEVDGVIYDRDTDQWFYTEHVSALRTPGPHAKLLGEERVLHAIQHKIDRGAEYDKNKRLVTVIEDAQEWFPNRVGKAIHGKHHFDAVYVIGLITDSNNGHSYSVSQLDGITGHSPTWQVDINDDFTDWTVTRLQ